MSYDLAVAVKVEGCDQYATIAMPAYAHPTCNLRDMFVACMDWNYKQGEYYPAKEYLPKIELGTRELNTNREFYKRYNPQNGGGSIDSALEALKSWRDCIYDESTYIPIECLYIRW